MQILHFRCGPTLTFKCNLYQNCWQSRARLDITTDVNIISRKHLVWIKFFKSLRKAFLKSSFVSLLSHVNIVKLSFKIYLRHPPQVWSSFILFTSAKLDEFLPTNNDKAELRKTNFVGLFSGITVLSLPLCGGLFLFWRQPLL